MQRGGPKKQFESFSASELFCPRCRAAMPVRERLLLVLPDGDLHEYCCSRCGQTLGKRKVDHRAGGGKVLTLR